MSRFGCILLLGVTLGLRPEILSAQDQAATPEQLVAQGDEHLRQGKTRAARKAYRQALKRDDDLIAAHLGLAQLDLKEQQWDDAKDRLQDVLERQPDHVEAHYYRAIAYRELAKFHTLNQARHWQGAEDDFAWILQQDSLYRDVLYQYALLQRYREAYPEAIAAGHAQVRLKPELIEAQRGLFRFYRSFLNHTSVEEARTWLQTQTTTHAEYFVGETLRRQERFDEAEAIFRGLLIGSLAMPVQPILLSRARLYYQQKNPKRAQGFIEQAIEKIEGPLEAALVFDDFKYIINDEELTLYRTLDTPEEYQAFFQAFWVRRNPLPARSPNLRLTEHYRRLLVAERDYAYDGFRLWYSNPDRRGDLVFPAAYALNQEFNDKGLIFIRHGEPDDREAQVGGDMEFRTVIDNTDVYGTPAEYSYSAGWRPNESWRYNRPRQMDFHFVVDEGGGANNWRLTPALTHFGMLESREHWGPPYSEMTRAARTMVEVQGKRGITFSASDAVTRSLDEEVSDEEAQVLDSLRARSPNLNMLAEQNRSLLEFITLRQRMVEQSRKAVTLALTTDQHTWQDDVVLIPMPYVPAVFRGDDGQTRLEIHFALPLGAITNALDNPGNTVEIEMGYAVHDTAWRSVAGEVKTKRVPTTTDPTAALIDFYQFTVPPDSYHVSLHGFTTRTGQVGGDTFSTRLPDFSQPTLAMSDLLLADYIGPAQMSRYDRGALHVSPNPFLRFSTQQPVFVYFEVYHLSLNKNDQTRFTIEYTLMPQKPKKVLGIINRKTRAALSVSTKRSGEDPSPVEWIEIDVRKVDPGHYTLIVTITDRLTGETYERSRPIELYRYE
ncbi:MAG: tetratricopeptide repeat protein [Rhodothermales bacterium]